MCVSCVNVRVDAGIEARPLWGMGPVWFHGQDSSQDSTWLSPYYTHNLNLFRVRVGPTPSSLPSNPHPPTPTHTTHSRTIQQVILDALD